MGGAGDSSSIPAAPNLARHSLRECHVARLSSASRMKSFLRFPRYIFESQTTSTLSSSSCRQTLKTSHLPHLEARTLKADGIHSASSLRISTSTRKDFRYRFGLDIAYTVRLLQMLKKKITLTLCKCV